MKVGLILVAIVGFAFASCGGGGNDDNGGGQFLSTLIRQLVNGEGGKAYETMVPAQQAIVSRDLYVQCVGADTITWDLKGVDIEDTYDEEYLIPGTQKHVTARALVYRIHAKEGNTSHSYTDTAHLIDMDGKWRWALNDPQPFIEGRCP